MSTTGLGSGIGLHSNKPYSVKNIKKEIISEVVQTTEATTVTSSENTAAEKPGEACYYGPEYYLPNKKNPNTVYAEETMANTAGTEATPTGSPAAPSDSVSRINNNYTVKPSWTIITITTASVEASVTTPATETTPVSQSVIDRFVALKTAYNSAKANMEKIQNQIDELDKKISANMLILLGPSGNIVYSSVLDPALDAQYKAQKSKLQEDYWKAHDSFMSCQTALLNFYLGLTIDEQAGLSSLGYSI